MLARLQSQGVVPIERRNALAKCAWSANPQINAMWLRGSLLTNINSCACAILRSMM